MVNAPSRKSSPEKIHKKPGKLAPNRVSLALAVFIMRPQAATQIGADESYHPHYIGVNQEHRI